MTKDDPHSPEAVVGRIRDAIDTGHGYQPVPTVVKAKTVAECLRPGDRLPNGLEVCWGWISIKEQQPDHSEPIVYARPKSPGKWSVGIAYWTVSEKWMPEMECEKAPAGFTHWKPLGAPPS